MIEGREIALMNSPGDRTHLDKRGDREIALTNEGKEIKLALLNSPSLKIIHSDQRMKGERWGEGKDQRDDLKAEYKELASFMSRRFQCKLP